MSFWCTCQTLGKLLPRPHQLAFVPAFRGSNLLWWLAFAAAHPSGGSWVKTFFSVTLLSAKVSFSTISGDNSLIIDLCEKIHLRIFCRGVALRSARFWPSCKP